MFREKDVYNQTEGIILSYSMVIWMNKCEYLCVVFCLAPKPQRNRRK